MISITAPKNKVVNRDLPKPNRPTNWKLKIEDFLSYCNTLGRLKEGYNETIKRNSKNPIFRFKYTDIQDDKLLDLFLNRYYVFDEYLRERLAKYVRLESNLERVDNDLIDSIHIIFDLEDKIKSRIIEDFTSVMKIGQICTFVAKIVTPNIHKITLLKKVEYKCRGCDSIFFKENNLYGMRHMGKPDGCVSPKCKNKWFDEEDIVGKIPLDIGYFKVGDLDPLHIFNELTCKVFRNLPYFIDVFNTTNINETILITGILRTDDSYLFRRKTAKDEFSYKKYIEVIDINPLEKRELDEDMLKILKQKLSEKPNYLRKLIDAIFPLSFGIDLLFNIKISLLLSYVSGGSWNEEIEIRDTINSVIISGGGVFKSSTQRNLKRLLADRDCLFFSGKNITTAGFMGTTRRNKDLGTTEIRTGIVTQFSNGTIYLDEANLITKDKQKREVIDIIRDCENGEVQIIHDALHFPAPAKASYSLIMNSLCNESGFYDDREAIWTNMGLDKENALSLIERFDLLCVVSKPDNTVERMIQENRTLQDKKVLNLRVLESLEYLDYTFPDFVLTDKEKLQYILRNWLYSGKIHYRNQELPRKQTKKITAVYDQALNRRETMKDFENEISINQRVQNTCERLIKGISALYLLNKANDESFDFFKLRLGHLITALRDRKVKLLQLKGKEDHKKIFIETAQNLLKRDHILALSDHITYMRNSIKRIYYSEIDFNYKGDDDGEKEKIATILKQIDCIVKSGTSLGKNYPYSCLLSACEKDLNRLGIYKKRFSDRICLIKDPDVKRGDLFNREDNLIIRKILESVNEIFEENDKEAVELSSLLSGLGLLFEKLSDEQIFEYLDLLNDYGYLEGKVLEGDNDK